MMPGGDDPQHFRFEAHERDHGRGAQGEGEPVRRGGKSVGPDDGGAEDEGEVKDDADHSGRNAR